MRGHIAGAAGIGIVPQGTADGRSLFEDDEIRVAGLLQPDPGTDAARPGTDYPDPHRFPPAASLLNPKLLHETPAGHRRANLQHNIVELIAHRRVVSGICKSASLSRTDRGIPAILRNRRGETHVCGIARFALS